MIAKALRRARTRYGLFIIAALLFTAGVFGAVGLTSGIFQARFDSKTATFAGGYLAVPTIAGVLPQTNTGSGYDGVLTWTNGTDETTTANEIQQIFGADQGTTANCTGASYSTTVASSITSPTTTTAFTYTDSNRATTPSNINGDYYCYKVVHGWPVTTTPDWTAAATTNVQIGLAPTSVTIANGTGCAPACAAGTIDGKSTTTGDLITITYNQPVTMTSGTGTSTLCTYQTEGVIVIGDALGCTAMSTATSNATVGKISMTVSGGGEHKKTTCNITFSGNQILIRVTQAGATVTNTSTRKFVTTAGTTVRSSVATDQASPCTSVAVTCTMSSVIPPGTVSGGF
jgi:hypothetical protein